MTMTEDRKLACLSQFTGTENWWRHPLVRSICYTDGAKYVADAAGAYWLLDAIALANRYVAAVQAEAFQVWALAVHPGQRGLLTGGDGNGRQVYVQEIACTDFPAPGITLWCTDGVIMLPGEY